MDTVYRDPVEAGFKHLLEYEAVSPLKGRIKFRLS